MNIPMLQTKVKLLKYGNTNTYFVKGTGVGVLVDTDWAGTLPAFFKAIKTAVIKMEDIGYVLITHFHPDHMGIAGELAELGIKPLIVDVQREYVHCSDEIFRRSGVNFVPIDKSKAVYISCVESRGFLRGIGIDGEIIYTPGHSADSVSLILDGGATFVGDLPPFDVIDGCDDIVKASWNSILSHNPNVVYYGHANERHLKNFKNKNTYK